MPTLRGYDALEDSALVALVSEGDGTALDAVYARYGRASFALASRVLAEPALARGVVERVFLTLWRDPARLDAARGGLSAWLLSETHEHAVALVRREENLRRRRRPDQADDFTAGVAPAYDGAAWGALRREGVRAALTGLPESQRIAVGLAYYGGFTQREIARITDTPLPLVKTRMLAGLRRLRDVLDPTLEVVER